MFKRKWLIVLVVLLVLGGFWYYSKTRASQGKIETVKPQVRDITESLDVSGNVDAKEKANLKFVAASKLTWIAVKEGDAVKKWQAIAAVDASMLQKQMQIDQNLHGVQFRSMEQTFSDNNYFGNQGLTDSQRRKVEDAQLNLRNTALTVEMQAIAVKNSTMVSPINGLVTHIDQPNVGTNVFPTDMVQIINPHSVYFAVVVDEADIGKLRASQSASLVLDAYPEETLNSVVQKIAFTPSQSQSGGLGYQVDLSMPDGQLLPKYRMGMSGDVKIVLNRKTQVLSVPTDALVERNGKQSVQVLVNDKPSKVEVVTGISDGNFTEIKSGLTANDNVIMPTAGK